jgi:hypothetical protein
VTSGLPDSVYVMSGFSVKYIFLNRVQSLPDLCAGMPHALHRDQGSALHCALRIGASLMRLTELRGCLSKIKDTWGRDVESFLQEKFGSGP